MTFDLIWGQFHQQTNTQLLRMGVHRLFSRGGQTFLRGARTYFLPEKQQKRYYFSRKSLKTYYFWQAREGQEPPLPPLRTPMLLRMHMHALALTFISPTISRRNLL
jgi:hypothetical protein